MKSSAFAFSLHSRFIALATLIALVAWSLGLPAWIHTAQAANVQDFKDTISDSDLGVDAQHDIFFTTANAMTSQQGFRIYFGTTTGQFSLTSVTDADLVASSTGFTAVNSCGGDPDEIDLSIGSDANGTYVQGEVCTGDTVPAGLIGLQVGDGQFLNNPSVAGSYPIRLVGNAGAPGGAIADSGDTRIAIIDDVTVTATVETVFTFTINGVDEGVTVNGDIATVATSTATTVPFGVIPIDTEVMMAQELRVDTNAINGFSVTVQADQTLTAGNLATIDEFNNGTPQATPLAWAVPNEVLATPDTWGHWGLTTDDDTLFSGLDFTTSPGFVGNFVANPVEVFAYNGPVSYAQGGQGVGSTTVGYKIEISPLQEAANDYTATLTYIATPIF